MFFTMFQKRENFISSGIFDCCVVISSSSSCSMSSIFNRFHVLRRIPWLIKVFAIKVYIVDVYTPRIAGSKSHRSHTSTESMRLMFINYMYKQKKVEMRSERIEKRSTVLFAVVALSAVTLMLASQHASAAVVVHHKVTVQHNAETGSKVHHKIILVDPQAHGVPLLNATALNKELAKEVKGPYGEHDIIGGMMSGGY
jgi:hypothetical protein